MLQSPDEKHENQRHVEQDLNKLRSRITHLEKQAQKAEADIKVRYNQKLSQIRDQFAQVKRKLNALREYEQDDYLDLKTELEREIDALEEGIEAVSHHISVPSQN